MGATFWDVQGDGSFNVVDITAVCVAISAVLGAGTLLRWKVIRPMRLKTRRAYAHSVVEAMTPVVNRLEKKIEEHGALLGEQGARVDNLSGKLLEHLTAEGDDISEIRTDQSSMNSRMAALEDGQTKICEKLDIPVGKDAP